MPLPAAPNGIDIAHLLLIEVPHQVEWNSDPGLADNSTNIATCLPAQDSNVLCGGNGSYEAVPVG